MRHLILKYFLFFILIGHTVFGQKYDNEDFKSKLSYIDVTYSERKVLYTFVLKKEENTPEVYAGEYQSSGSGETINVSAINIFSEKEVSQELEKKVLSIIKGINFVAFTPYTKFIKKHLEIFECEKVSENQWKFTAIENEIKKVVSNSENMEYYFLVTLNNTGEITDTESFSSGNKTQNPYQIKTLYKKENNNFHWYKVQGKIFNSKTKNVLDFSIEML